ncbi:MAG: EAL domain-containing protein [Gammaproteobacteria bacterium]|nr:EAL domain-containing protein [Gammaproteobacteria bacterium]MDH3413587.1 EAL domain-containing protein [Gammaproteobacteria bacterium]
MTDPPERQSDRQRPKRRGQRGRFGSLAFKVLLVVIPIELTILAVSGLFYIERLGSAIDDRLRARIEVPGALIARGVMNISSVSNPEAIRNLVGEELINGLVVDKDSRVIYSLEPAHRGKTINDVYSRTGVSLGNLPPEGVFFETASGLAKVTPVYTLDRANPAYFTVFEISTQHASREKRSIFELLFIGSIFVTLVTALCVFLLFRATVETRIRKLLEVLARLSGGDLSARVGEKVANDEIGVLQDEIDAMAQRLEFRDREKREVQAAQEESEARFKDFADTAADWFWETDWNHRVSFLSEGFEERTGVSSETMIGYRINELNIFDFENSQQAARFVRAFRSQRPFHQIEIPYTTDVGEKRIARISGKPILSAKEKFLGFRGTGIDVTEEFVLSNELSYQASHDELTGLVNRREFDIRLRRVLINAHAQNSSHALCYLDLDQFKVVNDTCGHVAGDELLRRMGAVLQETVRKGDTLARLGGDEFGVLLEYCDLAQARRVARVILEAVEAFEFEWEESKFKIGVSIGLVPITAASGDVTEVLSAADTACYEAKDQGRNRIHVYHADDEDLVRRHGEMQWVGRINRALDEDRFVLFYQPIVHIANSAAHGERMELLVRMIDEEGALLLPGRFLPAAERYGLAAKLDRWVVQSAIRWLSEHRASRTRLEMCAINVSGHTLNDEGFVSFVISQLEASQVPPSLVCFELTETSAIANLKSAIAFMTELQKIGCRFALDDFGSGVSSFAYLRSLPVDILKIDGQFVRDMATDEVDAGMVTAIHEIARVMKKETVAEFVETQAVLEKLKKVGIDFAQGYGVGRPAPLESLEGDPSRKTPDSAGDSKRARQSARRRA